MALKTKAFGELITFARATGGGRFNAAGQYEWLPANEPRIDYDPVTGECRGILIEEQRTNLLTASEDFTGGPWKANRASITSAPLIAAPSGVVGGVKKLVESTDTGSHFVSFTNPVSSGGSYAFTIFVKAAERSSVRIEALTINGWDVSLIATINLSTLSIESSFPGSFSVRLVGDGWVRISVTNTTATTGNKVMSVSTALPAGNISYAGDGTSGIFIWGAQLEVGSFPTSYIPTTTAQVTRAGDLCSVNSLSPWYRADEGTLIVEATVISSRTPPQVLIGIGDGTIKNRLQLRVANNNLAGLRIVSSGDQEVDAAVVSQNLVSTTSKLASSFSGGFQRSSVNGVLHGIAAPVSALPLVTVLQIGRGEGSSILQGYIRRIRYIPRRVSDTELQALTA